MPHVIEIDRDELPDGHVMARHLVILDPDNHIEHPEVPGGKITTADYLSWLNVNRDKMQAHGWHMANQLHDETAPLTRWDRLVREMNKLPDDHPHKVKGLK